MKYLYLPAGTPINSVIVSLETRHARNSKLVSQEHRVTDIPMYFEVNGNVSIEYEYGKPRLYTFWIEEEKVWFCFNVLGMYVEEA